MLHIHYSAVNTLRSIVVLGKEYSVYPKKIPSPFVLIISLRKIPCADAVTPMSFQFVDCDHTQDLHCGTRVYLKGLGRNL